MELRPTVCRVASSRDEVTATGSTRRAVALCGGELLGRSWQRLATLRFAPRWIRVGERAAPRRRTAHPAAYLYRFQAVAELFLLRGGWRAVGNPGRRGRADPR